MNSKHATTITPLQRRIVQLQAIMIFHGGGPAMDMVQEEAQNCLERNIQEELEGDDYGFSALVDELLTCYPRWIAFHQDEAAE